MDRTSLAELREMWAIAVLFGDRARWERARPPLPCWFGRCVPGIDGCEGRLEGAHWIKRQRVEGTLCHNFQTEPTLRSVHRYVKEANRGASLKDMEPRAADAVDLVLLAAWDPRNGVPACSKHHARFDGHRVDATNELIVWRHEVPAPVESFCTDWGLETALEDRNPAIGSGV